MKYGGGAEVLTDEGRGGLTERDAGEDQDEEQDPGRGVGRDGRGAKGREEGHEDQTGPVPAEVVEGPRGPDAHDRAQRSWVRAEVVEAEPEVVAEERERDDERGPGREECGPGRAGQPALEAVDQERVEHEVAEGQDRARHERRSALAGGLEREERHDEGRAQEGAREHDLEVARGPRVEGSERGEAREEGPGREDSDQREDRSEQPAREQTLSCGGSGARPGSSRSRDRGERPEPEAEERGEGQQPHGLGHAEAGQGLGSELSDPESIAKRGAQIEDAPRQERRREANERAQRGSLG